MEELTRPVQTIAEERDTKLLHLHLDAEEWGIFKH